MNKVHIGTMGWSYKFWIDNFYPRGLKAEEYLAEYAKHFNTVEVDSTFYRIPYESTVEKWKDQTPPDFSFSAKFPRIITHGKMLINCEDEVTRFLEKISKLESKLGPLLLQFPSAFKSKQIQLLSDFLPKLPKGYRFAVEVRNKELLNDKFYSILREQGVALVLLDRPLMPEMETMTADFTYIRWEGDRKKVKGTLGKVEVDRTADIKMWAERIERFLDVQIKVFGYFSKYYSGHAPSDAKQILEFL
jgi:uncharacterized protein YecE (DUF72 family)